MQKRAGKLAFMVPVIIFTEAAGLRSPGGYRLPGQAAPVVSMDSDLPAGSHDQVGKFVNHHHDIWQEMMPFIRIQPAGYEFVLYSLIFLTCASFKSSYL